MNHIPRSATRLSVVMLTNTSAGKAPLHMTAHKEEDGHWCGVDGSGRKWRLCAEHLRNDALCKIEVLK